MAAVKLDENVPDSVATVLREAGHDVALARDQQLVGAVDERVLSVAASEGRVLVTLDRDFTDIRRRPTAGHRRHHRVPDAWADTLERTARSNVLWSSSAQ